MNTLVGTFRPLAFRLAGEPATLTLQAARPGIAAAAAFGRLRLRCGEHRFDLGLPAVPDPARFGMAFAGIELDALPEDILLGAIEAWLEETVAALNSRGVSLDLESWQATTPDEEPACVWELSRA